jgi:PTH1 family peptidyl-tRNA hydrolase
MKLLVIGLGNPGKKYQTTRHNSGFIVLDEIAKHNDLVWKNQAKIKSSYCTLEDYIFLKPQTFMNKSGQAVGQSLSYFKMESSQICIIHDDADIDLLEHKVQFGRQAAGHHGIEDVIKHLGTNDFWRIRIGVGRPEERSFDIEDWVLSNYSHEELEHLKKLVPVLEKELENIKSSLRL